jgi:hypothetical protein
MFRLAFESRSKTIPQHGQGKMRSERESVSRWPDGEQSCDV